MEVIVSLDMRELKILSTKNNKVLDTISIEEGKHCTGFRWSPTELISVKR